VTPQATTVAGIFIGGRALRMGGQPKGLMRGPQGVTLVERWRAMMSGLGIVVVLVGDAPAYAALGLPTLRDAPPGIGPLGGLVALLRHVGEGTALALACDMPFVSRGLIERLLEAPRHMPIVAPRRESRWEPLCARYDASHVLPLAIAQAAATHHSLQRLLDEGGAVELGLLEHEGDELHDWDSPEDVR
jgi:molybdopterin-guanine dinucleotide biosynthesis protein A